MVRALDSGRAVFLVASCYRYRDKLQTDEPFGSYAGFTLHRIKAFLPLTFIYKYNTEVYYIPYVPTFDSIIKIHIYIK